MLFCLKEVLNLLSLFDGDAKFGCVVQEQFVELPTADRYRGYLWEPSWVPNSF